MNDGVKVAGIFGSALVCMVSLVLGEREFAYASGGMLAILLGLQPIGKGIQKLSK